MKILAKPFLWMMTAIMSMCIAACNVSPASLDDTLKGTVKNRAGQGIPNIKVSCMGLGIDGGIDAGAGGMGTEVASTSTLQGDGWYELSVTISDCDFLRFQDVDGAENGSYLKHDLFISGVNEVHVVLEEKN